VGLTLGIKVAKVHFFGRKTHEIGNKIKCTPLCNVIETKLAKNRRRLGANAGQFDI
jgi:hypothetical protein